MTYKILLLTAIILNFLCIGYAFKTHFLSGQWNVRNKNNSINIPATVPGGIYSDLMCAKILDDIYFRFNDIDYRWVANETWIYTLEFYADDKYFKHIKNIDLVFDGLDTFSTILLNSEIIATSNNMFVRYSFNIKPYLKKGENKLTVIFKSPIAEANKLHREYEKKYIIPPLCVPKEYNGECHANLIRKMQASFSWDWGPAFPSVGIWKEVYIRSYTSAVVQDVTVNIVEDNDRWNINLEIYLESTAINTNLLGQIKTILHTDINEVNIFTDINGKINNNGEYKQNVVLWIPKNHVQLWWPNGFGKQSLYDLSVSFTPSGYKEKRTKRIKIGFRKIELVQNPVEKGLTFYFKVNNIPIFSKGSNWIPANVLPEKGANINELRFLLQSAKDVHMNMLRVWGGGVYESDAFYDLADEYGILIWQDFMFACSMYPVNEEFLQSVKLEVQQQVRRLQHHPSMALWAGNNENEAALRDNWYGTADNFTLYKKDYVTLYVDTIRNVCLENDKSRSFVVSSPSNGLQSEKEGFVALYPYDTHYGDIHYYNYMMDGWDQNIYSRTRFSSEYGFQSLPNYETMLSSTNITSDLVINSEFLESRQHHPSGYSEMKLLISKQMNLPNESKENYLKTFIYYTQISQAMSYKAQTEYYRQWRSKTDEDGNGLTMGALYWQLNDVWPAPSWSSIDFRQRWKMVHYYAKKFFAPLLISANISPSKQVTIFALSDLTTTTVNVTITLTVFKWDNFKPLYTENLVLNILPGYSTIINEFWLYKLEVIGCGTLKTVAYNCFLYFSLKDSAGEMLGPDNFVFPAPLNKIVGLTTPHLKIQVAKSADSTLKQTNFNITVSTDRIAPFVWLETGALKGKFSDNGFLQVTKYKTIQFECTKTVTQAQLQSSLTVTSLLSPEHL